MKEPFLEPVFRRLRFYKIEKLIPLNSVVCDLGCGPRGELLKHIQSRIEKGAGFDNLVEPFCGEKISLMPLNLDIESIPLKDESVDTVVSLAVLEHLENPLHLIKEAYRILKKGGSLLLTTPTPLAKPVLEFLAYRLCLISKREIDEHKYYFSKNELSDLLIKCGFSDNRIISRVFQLGFNNFIHAVK